MPYLIVRCMIVSIFFLADASDGRQTAELQGRIDFPSVRKLVRHEAVVTDDLTDTPVNQHVAYGHHAAGPADVFTDQIVSRYVVRMVCQQESSAAACGVVPLLCPVSFYLAAHMTMSSQICDGVKNCPFVLLVPVFEQ